MHLIHTLAVKGITIVAIDLLHSAQVTYCCSAATNVVDACRKCAQINLSVHLAYTCFFLFVYFVLLEIPTHNGQCNAL